MVNMRGCRFRDGYPRFYRKTASKRLANPGLTSDVCGGTLPSTWGDVAVQQRRRMLVLVLLAGVFGGCAVPPVDLPETSFNESDAPVNLAPPSQATVRFVRPVSDPLLMPGLRFYCAGCDLSSRVPGPVATPRQRHPHYSLQDLLCTFLI
jgi:hypothetical protein